MFVAAPGKDVSDAAQVAAGPYGRPEHRFDESRGLLPELLFEVAQKQPLP